MNLQKAVELLNAGQVVGFPTETVYGLAARIDHPQGIERIFTTKQRPFFDPLIVHVSSIAQAKHLTRQWTKTSEVLAKAFWPGPLTLVLPKSEKIHSMITSGLENVGLRMPDHPMALKLISEVGVALAAPSANKFGRTSPTKASHVQSEFGDEVFVLDGGPCQVGIESTVLKVEEDANGISVLTVLRPGSVTTALIRGALEIENLKFRFEKSADPRQAPGQMQHHYMPEIPLILVEGLATDLSKVTAFANERLPQLPDQVEGVKLKKPAGLLQKPALLNLQTDASLAARELYSLLREKSQSGADHLVLFVDDSFKNENWSGVMDRLRKAASLTVSSAALKT